MSPETQHRALEIFAEAADLPPLERERHLASVCEGNRELRGAVDALIRADLGAPASFLSQPAMYIAAGLITPPAPVIAGTVIGNYRVVRHLGSGGMGTVYEALDSRLNRPVALKLLLPVYAGDPERVQRFEQEARAASRLNHPNIVSIFDANSDANRGALYLATELVTGQTLRELSRGVRLTPKELVDVTIQIASALSAAHTAGIVHRDMKPENVMLRPDGIVKVLDFGLAKLFDPGSSDARPLETRTGNIAGTVHYLSPEQVLGSPAGPRSDLFSLGVVLYELCTGVRPFEGPTDGAIFDAIVHRSPAHPSALRPEISRDFESIILRLLQKDPELRFQTANDLRAALRYAIRESQPSGFTLPLAPVPIAPDVPVSRRAWRRWAAAAAALAVCSGVGWWAGASSAAKPAAGGGAVLHSFERQSDEPGEDLFPSLSADGKQFVYASARAGNWDIYLRRSGGLAAVNLTPDFNGVDTTPVFSHDGTRIAFRSERDGGGIFVMEATGENPRRVSRAGFYPSWSPGDDRLVCSDLDFSNPSRRRRDRKSQLVVVELAGGGERSLPAPPDAIQPVWSPHGQRIAYWGLVANTSQRDIFTIAADGSGAPVAVTNDKALDWNPVWSPSGNELYFLSNRGGTMNAWRVVIDERSGKTKGEPEPVTLPAVYARHLSLAANGSQLAFVRAEAHTSLFMARFDPVALSFEAPPTSIGDGRSSVASFGLSPDETKIAYDTLGDAQEDIWIMNADGTGRRRLTNDRWIDRDPTWSPDGKEVGFYSDRDGETLNAWAIGADGGGLRRLTDLPSSLGINSIAWSHDGQQVLVLPEPLHSAWVPSRGVTTRPTQLPGLQAIDWGYFVAWNPPVNPAESDLWLMVVREAGRMRVWLYHMRSGKAEPTPVFGTSPSWLPGQRQFLFARQGKLWVYDLISGKERAVHSVFPNDPWELRVSRDGRRVYFSQTTRDGEIWLGQMSNRLGK